MVWRVCCVWCDAAVVCWVPAAWEQHVGGLLLQGALFDGHSLSPAWKVGVHRLPVLLMHVLRPGLPSADVSRHMQAGQLSVSPWLWHLARVLVCAPLVLKLMPVSYILLLVGQQLAHRMCRGR